MGFYCGASCPGKRQRLAWPLLAVALSACQILPDAADDPDSTPGPQPADQAALRDDLAVCEAQLAVALEARNDLSVSLAAQSSTLTDVQGALRRIESRLNQQDRLAAESGPDQICEVPLAEVTRKLVVGRRENVWIEALQMALPARIDTGAETASLDARNIERFERDGKGWVRFDILDPQDGELVHLEQEVTRTVRILQSSSDSPERRPVIEMGIVIGDIRQTAEFTLSDRSHLDFQVLIGRNILRDLMIVDVSQTDITDHGMARVKEKRGADES